MSDSAQRTNNVSRWQRLIRLRLRRAGTPTGTPPAANPQSINTHDNNIARSGIEHDADLEQGNVQPAEDEGPLKLTEEVDLQPSPFTSSAFDRLPSPLPVEDIFFNVSWLKAVRAVVRSFVLYISWYLMITSWEPFFSATFILFSRYVFLKAGYTTVFGISIQSKARLLRGFLIWVQKFWVYLHTQS